MNDLNAIKQFVSLRDSITAERETIINRLREIDAALGSIGMSAKDGYFGPRAAAGRSRNELSLRDTILKVLKEQSLTKHEILDAVLAAGYQFATNDPLNSLGVILYGRNSKFKNNKGRFSLK